MGCVDPRMWTPSITPRTTESSTCWTSATLRAGKGQKDGQTLSRPKHFAHLIFIFSRDLAVIVASMAYNTWFTKLYCKDLRIVSLNVPVASRSVSDESLNVALSLQTQKVGFKLVLFCNRGQRSLSRSCTQSASPPAWRRSPWRTLA